MEFQSSDGKVLEYGTSGKFRLRNFMLHDIPTRVEWFNDQYNRSRAVLPDNVTIDGTTRWFYQIERDPTRCDFSLEDLENGKVAAFLGFRDRDRTGIGDLYIVVDRQQLGRGIGTIAFGLMIDVMRVSPHLRGARGGVAADNEPVIRLNRRFGMEVVGRQPDGRLTMEVHWK